MDPNSRKKSVKSDSHMYKEVNEIRFSRNRWNPILKKSVKYESNTCSAILKKTLKSDSHKFEEFDEIQF